MLLLSELFHVARLYSWCKSFQAVCLRLHWKRSSSLEGPDAGRWGPGERQETVCLWVLLT